MGSTCLAPFLGLILVTEDAVSAPVAAVQPHVAGCFISGLGH